MTADLVITEDMLLQMAKTYERLEESMKDLPAQLSFEVDAGICTELQCMLYQPTNISQPP